MSVCHGRERAYARISVGVRLVGIAAALAAIVFATAVSAQSPLTVEGTVVSRAGPSRWPMPSCSSTADFSQSRPIVTAGSD